MDENLNEELEDNIVTLKDDEGNNVDFEFLDVIEYEGSDYVVLLPIESDEGEEAEEVVILKEDKDFVGEEDESSYVSVDDETVLNTVFQIFKERFKDEFNFTEEE